MDRVGDGPLHRKRRRFSRSKAGCLTCKQRKVKCDEERPECGRCRADGRDCLGYANASSSSSSGQASRKSVSVAEGHPPHLQPHPHQQLSSSSSSAVSAAQSTHSQIDLDTLLDSQVSPSTVFPDDAFANSTGDTTQLDDWLYLIYNSSTTVDLSSGLTNWPNLSTETSMLPFVDHHPSNNSFFEATSTSSPQQQVAAAAATSTSDGSSGSNSTAGGGIAVLAAAAASSSAVTNHTPRSSRRTIDVELDVARVLNGQLRSLCTSALQFDAICRFFDFVAQCFHLLPSSQNLWRKVFGQLCTESPLILKLTTAVGLVSLTHCGTIHKRPLAYALLAQSLSKWKQILAKATKTSAFTNEEGGQSSYVFSELTILEVLAGAILVGHFEQFDTGLASSTTQCMADVNRVIHAVVTGRVAGSSSIDTDKGSMFRFLVKIYLWWDTLSATLCVGTEAGYNDNRAIFDAVHRWEIEEDDVLQSCQCITGWPLSLLETVAKVRECCSASNPGQGGEKSSIDMLEAEILVCRPRVVPGDSLRVAELRYVIFEMLATGVLIYCHRLAYGHCDRVQREVKRIVHFLGKRERDRLQPGPAHHSSSEGLAWIDRAPDGTLVWAYFQAAMTVRDRTLQEQSERSMNAWIAFADCAAVNVEMFMLRAMWSKLLEHGKEANLNTLYEQVCRETRWTHPLIL